ncbi:Oidioi.mRNA.OKI2018_I69.PAR.g9850.t1.cds [Oikopleura dioica]|uniref:Oidioi.mRNA.OKI2018_I69.PAR.g9850.t1.cds n=1 Tax=Oikopleura dioica TaxID=34765 RepID=A0ABN7RML5_OIKDI|nr:Oidioi.mRNA.OKI2018_I69.PAR.g9850.t1.cds [Oikopleura dioica]
MKLTLAYFLINFCSCDDSSEESFNHTEYEITGWPNDILDFSKCFDDLKFKLNTTKEIGDNKLRTLLLCNVTFEAIELDFQPNTTTTITTTTKASTTRPEATTTDAPTTKTTTTTKATTTTQKPTTTKATTTTTKATSTAATTKTTTTTEKATTTTTKPTTEESDPGTDTESDKETRKTNTEKSENKKEIREYLVIKEVHESSVPIFRTWGGAVFLQHISLGIAILIIWSNQISLGLNKKHEKILLAIWFFIFIALIVDLSAISKVITEKNPYPAAFFNSLLNSVLLILGLMLVIGVCRERERVQRHEFE